MGASSYGLLSLELEEKLTQALSVVLFIDLLGQSTSINDYPFDEYLTSVGIGVRLSTFMGPIRLEYGHNIEPRAQDPDGTFHFAIGFPF